MSPWIVGKATQTFSSWNVWIVGIGSVAFTLRTFLPPPNKSAHERVRLAWWEEVLDNCALVHIAREQLVVGAWLLVAPWILGFAATGAAAWTAWIAGSVIVVLSVWKLLGFRSR